MIDLHNTGCVSFIYMIEVARALMHGTGARGALLCNVQNAGGRVFAHPEVRRASQAPVPGDGCGVGLHRGGRALAGAGRGAPDPRRARARRNWREALELPPEKHHDTFDRYGNLFGAAIPLNLEDSLAAGKLHQGSLLALGGFSHAGDYAAAAILRWG